MNLTRTTSTALAIIPKENKARPTSKSEESAPAKSDSVEIQGKGTPPAVKSFDGEAIPADDDGPGAGGGYKPLQDPAESDGPGAGGGYDGDEIPADDDGPGAGGGYDWVEQDPAESDGPGAGGGYLTEESSALTVRGHWSQPLAVFSANIGPHDIDVRTQYTPPWIQVLPQETFSWTMGTALEPLFVDTKDQVVQVEDPGSVSQEKKADKSESTSKQEAKK